jgi:hypothetical protein
MQSALERDGVIVDLSIALRPRRCYVKHRVWQVGGTDFRQRESGGQSYCGDAPDKHSRLAYRIATEYVLRVTKTKREALPKGNRLPLLIADLIVVTSD